MVTINPSIHYNEISQVYDVSRAANIETVEKIVRLLRIDKNSALLDMGCGTGNYTAALSKTSKNIIGIDNSTGMIRQARAKFPTLQFICGDIMSIPFKSEILDGAMAVQVLHHVGNKEKFLQETYRVLRKGSYFAIHTCSHKQLLAFWFCHYFPEGLEKEIERIPDTNVIASLLENAGFSDIGTERCYQDIVVAKETPEQYLDKNYRDGISTFSLITEEEIQAGCEKLREDIASGEVEAFIQKQKEKVAKIGGSLIICGQKV
ncbi:class I SAM-dependent methyltransferase [[Eubacterium] cellulosolvens]